MDTLLGLKMFSISVRVNFLRVTAGEEIKFRSFSRSNYLGYFRKFRAMTERAECQSTAVISMFQLCRKCERRNEKCSRLRDTPGN